MGYRLSLFILIRALKLSLLLWISFILVYLNQSAEVKLVIVDTEGEDVVFSYNDDNDVIGYNVSVHVSKERKLKRKRDIGRGRGAEDKVRERGKKGGRGERERGRQGEERAGEKERERERGRGERERGGRERGAGKTGATHSQLLWPKICCYHLKT